MTEAEFNNKYTTYRVNAQHLGSMTLDNTLKPPFEVAWKIPMICQTRAIGNPNDKPSGSYFIVIDEYIYSKYQLFAINVTNGNAIWNVTLNITYDGSYFYSPTYTNGTVAINIQDCLSGHYPPVCYKYKNNYYVISVSNDWWLPNTNSI